MPPTSTQMNPARRVSTVQWIIAALLGVIAACLLIEVGIATSNVKAQDAAPAAQKNGFFAVSGQLTRETYGLYLVDSNNGTIVTYEYAPVKGINQYKLRLVAARNVAFDLRLDDYNTIPQPREIKAIVEQNPRLNTATTQP